MENTLTGYENRKRFLMGSCNSGSKGTNNSSGLVVSQQDLSKITDDELKNLDNQFKTSIDVMNNELTRLVNNQTGTQSKEYYNARNQLTDLRNSHRKVIDEIVKRKSEKSKNTTTTKKTFVNSYGEATTRDITTSTYKQLQRKLNKQIMRFIGG